ncbi:hypothetical protein B5012_17570 [Salmonella enterica subsp. enterica serovar Dublin]|nr:hypothetical protein B5012_17570 [Salmonella enterica subsp. enterica serovar Dublin]
MSCKPRRTCSLTIYQTICVGTRRYGFLTSHLLFNNLSDNLCGHSKIRILNVLGRKMNTKSQE